MKQFFTEGTWFALPLRSRGFAVGVIARVASSGGIVLAYFFPKVWDHAPSMSDVKGLKPETAVRVLRVGDLSLVQGTWPVIGLDPAWRRGEWAVPEFIRRDDLSRRAWRVRYSDRDVNVVEFETPTEYETNLERDAVLGSGAAELVITKLLG